LTAVDIGERDFSVDISTETLQVTTMGMLAVGAPVNLERAMKLNERIGGAPCHGACRWGRDHPRPAPGWKYHSDDH